MSQAFRGRKGASRFTARVLQALGTVTKDSGRAVYQCLVPVVISTVSHEGTRPCCYQMTIWVAQLVWVCLEFGAGQWHQPGQHRAMASPCSDNWILLCSASSSLDSSWVPASQLGMEPFSASHCTATPLGPDGFCVESKISAETRRISPAWLHHPPD